jgi:LuxR family maltose regulon positive regulatory protein
MDPPGRLAPPRQRRGLVARPRLSRVLDGGREASLTLVVAPPGYGKTIAVEQWLAERGHDAAWVRADARDEDPVRLWASVAAAVERTRPGAGGDALKWLRDPAGAVAPAIEALAIALDADQRPIVLVLEDLQSITEQNSLRSLDHAVASLPGHVQLVLVSRAVPPIRLARLRAHRELVEIRASELAFTSAEAQELFAAVAGIALDEPLAEAFTARTEGWGAVLYLAALWLQDRRDPAAALRMFSAAERHVGEYLAAVVLGAVDPDTRLFLQRTAVLPYLCGSLCDAALRQTGSHGRLRTLERAILLVMPLAQRPGWYRYHALLREHLLAGLNPDEATTLRRRALAWSRSHELIEDAAEYARAAGDHDALIAVIEEHALALVRTGRSRTLVRWTAAIPQALLVAHPRALAAAIGAAHISGRPPEEVRRLLSLAVDADAELSRRHEGAMLHIARARYADDHVGEALAAAQAAVDISRHDRELLLPALAVLGLVRLLAGDDEGAADAARSAFKHPDSAWRPYGHATAAAVLALAEAHAGRRHTARTHADEALVTLRRSGLAGVSVSVPALLADGVVAALEGRLSHARRAAAQAAGAVIPGGIWQAWVLIEVARIELRRGHLLAAEYAAAHADELLAAVRDGGALPAQASAVRAETAAAAAGAPERPAQPLSPAELATLRLLPDHTVRETAQALYLSANTVKSHVRSIYRKLGVNAREDAVARAAVLGLLDKADPEAVQTP